MWPLLLIPAAWAAKKLYDVATSDTPTDREQAAATERDLEASARNEALIILNAFLESKGIRKIKSIPEDFVVHARFGLASAFTGNPLHGPLGIKSTRTSFISSLSQEFKKTPRAAAITEEIEQLELEISKIEMSRAGIAHLKRQSAPQPPSSTKDNATQ